MKLPLSSKPQQGFTLVEVVMVIVLLGILSVASTQFIYLGVDTYVDTSRRDILQQQARFASERISRELRNALPGSARTSADGSCLEFIPIAAASNYLSRVSDSSITELQAVDFNIPTSFSRVAIYTVDEFDVYDSSRDAISDVSSVSASVANVRTVTLSGAHQFASESPTHRFYLIDERVSFCAFDGSLVRYSGYDTSGEVNPQLQVLPDVSLHGGSQSLLAEHIRLLDGADTVAVFSFTPGTLQRSALVHINLRFAHRLVMDEWVRFSQDVFLRNTP